MPPKRKQVDDVAEAGHSTRSTRASTRTRAQAASKKASTTRAAAASGVDEDSDAAESVHSAKKARTTAPKKTTAKRSQKKGDQGDAESEVPRKSSSSKNDVQPKYLKTNTEPVSNPLQIPKQPPTPVPSSPPPSPPKSQKRPTTPPAMKTTTTSPVSHKKAGKIEPYTLQRAVEMFNTYADPDVPDTIGPEGFQQLCEDAQMPMEGARPLIFAWKVDSKEMGKITQEEWTKAMSSLKIASAPALASAIADLEELLFNEKPPKTFGKDYDKTAFNEHVSDPKAAFLKLYMFSFHLVKPQQSKNIEMETSIAFWTALLVPKYPLMSEIIDFINERTDSYKATNKDLWTMMLEFCETIKPTLENYEADGAWPTLLDDYVSWKLSNVSNGNANKMDED